MTIVNILPGANNKPAYIEYLKEDALSPTLLSIENFRSRFGDEETNHVLGIGIEDTEDSLEGVTEADAEAPEAASDAHSAPEASKSGDAIDQGLFSVAS
jgi:hypothetical protein